MMRRRLTCDAFGMFQSFDCTAIGVGLSGNAAVMLGFAIAYIGARRVNSPRLMPLLAAASHPAYPDIQSTSRALPLGVYRESGLVLGPIPDVRDEHPPGLSRASASARAADLIAKGVRAARSYAMIR